MNRNQNKNTNFSEVFEACAPNTSIDEFYHMGYQHGFNDGYLMREKIAEIELLNELDSEPKQEDENFNELSIQKIIVNGKHTVMFFEDGSKTMVKCSEDDAYSLLTGISFCILKKMMGEKNFKNMLKFMEHDANSKTPELICFQPSGKRKTRIREAKLMNSVLEEIDSTEVPVTEKKKSVAKRKTKKSDSSDKED